MRNLSYFESNFKMLILIVKENSHLIIILQENKEKRMKIN